MIFIKDVETGKNINFEITRFPDGTSQAWKLTPPPERMSKIEVIWMFENEAELITVCQLGDLLHREFVVFPTLNVPFLPFGRQDKRVGNQSTFAKFTFVNLIYESGYSGIKTYDAHSDSELVTSIDPYDFHKNIFAHNVICYPDQGAFDRYGRVGDVPVVTASKVRNQLTGEIESLKLSNTNVVKGANVLIIDDICDGGRTFTEVAKVLVSCKPASIDLCVSHGIFSKGLDVLFEAGIRNVYTTNSRMNMVYSGDLEMTGHKLTVFDIIDLGLNIDYIDLRKEERKIL